MAAILAIEVRSLDFGLLVTFASKFKVLTPEFPQTCLPQAIKFLIGILSPELRC